MFPNIRGTTETPDSFIESIVRKRKATAKKAGSKGGQRKARKTTAKKAGRKGRSRSRRRSRSRSKSRSRRGRYVFSTDTGPHEYKMVVTNYN